MDDKAVLKPMTILKEEFIYNLTKLCNNSGLPLFVMEYILKDLYFEVKSLAKAQYESDLTKYNNAIKKCNTECEIGIGETYE